MKPSKRIKQYEELLARLEIELRYTGNLFIVYEIEYIKKLLSVAR